MPARRKSGRARRTFSAGGVVYRQTAQGPFKTVTNYLAELIGDVARRTISFRNWGATLDAALASLTGLEEAS